MFSTWLQTLSNYFANSSKILQSAMPETETVSGLRCTFSKFKYRFASS